MSVEIRILSGVRRNERLSLDLDCFFVGDRHDCPVYFDPVAEPAARGAMAMIHQEEDGWHVTNCGEQVFLVNQSPVTRTARLRAGDVVRLSLDGPDLLFGLDEQSASAGGVAASLPASLDERPSPKPAATRIPCRWLMIVAIVFVAVALAFIVSLIAFR